MEDYKPNSNKYKEAQKNAPKEKPKFEKVVSGTAKTKKKSEVRKFADIFISEDVKNVKSFIFMDVLVPAIKKAVYDIFTDGIDMVLYGSTGHKKSRASRVRYDNIYNDGRNDRSREPYRPRSVYDYDEVSIPTRGEAERVLDRMTESVEVYGVVSVADLYDLVGVTSNFTDNKYGWTKHNFRGVDIRRVHDGYALNLPAAIPLD